ncbi:cytochrome b-c1 complex subunit 7 [Diachasma alloeum]|uniref:Cytochrome b-c1 complex subunit 7 n=1 Tax=Diachasma alloeum TaxID=454923 RepID=A0A4E0S4L9_9HYME|nr:cytochrome b-c1 complex subunit 7 [Diachasma alloeum]THK33263.1 14 kDa subunit, ubiquinol-cytochrome c reductase [Diachasma alloeum]
MATRRPNFILNSSWKQWAYNLSRFNQYGLRHDDCLYETPEVKEALRRLPAHLVDERTFRIVRAMQLSCNKVVLPKEQWTKFEEDTHYLRPYLDEVLKEIKEKKDWDKQ